MQIRTTVALGAVLLAAGGYRRWANAWGSTPAERRATLPGDEVPSPLPGLHATRAVTVDAPPADVWPWLLQLGTGKAGWYSYDLLDNLGRPSARAVLPQWQDVQVGDPAAPMNPLAPVTATPWRVRYLDPGRALVWQHPAMGTWAWALWPTPDGGTRLVSRLRLTYRTLEGAAFAPVLEVADFPMFRRMLLGIRERAEGASSRPGHVPGADDDRHAPRRRAAAARPTWPDAVTDDTGPFFHGTRVALRPGDLLTAGYRSNYRPEVVMNHVYFTALVDGAGLAAELAVELADGDAEPHVYEVEPTGPYVDDPNVTDTKFPGNPTRSYRSADPVRVVREVEDWTRLTPEALAAWRVRLATLTADPAAEILN